MQFSLTAVLPQGFKANGLHCGLKKSGRPDLALISADAPCLCSCLFTTNTVTAAPVNLCKEYLRSTRMIRAVVANSGNANCFTGAAGLADARAVSAAVSRRLSAAPQQVLVASTGIIGKRLNRRAVIAAVPALVDGLSARGLQKAAKAIMTTDALRKQASASFVLGGKKIIVSGIAKGAGMIAPNMATMLAFVMTDVRISRQALDKAVKAACRETFNSITVDGCMSTNDMLAVMASGCAGNSRISGGSSLAAFTAALKAVCLEMAVAMVKDGEGASKCISIEVSGARSDADARKVALAIANSNLFKTAVYGQNPNFGRIVAAAGASGVAVREKDIRVKMGPLTGKNVRVSVRLSLGGGKATVYTSDLTPQYIKINAAYN